MVEPIRVSIVFDATGQPSLVRGAQSVEQVTNKLAQLERTADSTGRALRLVENNLNRFSTALRGSSINALILTNQLFERLFFNLERLARWSFYGLVAGISALGYGLHSMIKQFFSINEQFANLEISIRSVMGSTSAAIKIRDELARITITSPLPFKDIADSVRAVAIMPTLGQRLALQTQGGTLSNPQGFLRQYIGLIEQMTTFRPDRHAYEAVFSMREALAGEMRSLIRRFNFPVSLLVSASGKPIQELKKSPSDTFAAMKTAFDAIIAPAAVREIAKQPTKLWQNIVEQAVQIPMLQVGRIGERKQGGQGLYQHVLDVGYSALNRFGNFSDVNKGAFNAQAERLSDKLIKLFDTVLGAADRITERLLHLVHAGADDLPGISKVERVYVVLENAISYVADNFPRWIEAIQTEVARFKPLFMGILGMFKGVLGGLMTMFQTSPWLGLLGAFTVQNTPRMFNRLTERGESSWIATRQASRASLLMPEIAAHGSLLSSGASSAATGRAIGSSLAAELKRQRTAEAWASNPKFAGVTNATLLSKFSMPKGGLTMPGLMAQMANKGNFYGGHLTQEELMALIGAKQDASGEWTSAPGRVVQSSDVLNNPNWLALNSRSALSGRPRAFDPNNLNTGQYFRGMRSNGAGMTASLAGAGAFGAARLMGAGAAAAEGVAGVAAGSAGAVASVIAPIAIALVATAAFTFILDKAFSYYSKYKSAQVLNQQEALGVGAKGMAKFAEREDAALNFSRDAANAFKAQGFGNSLRNISAGFTLAPGGAQVLNAEQLLSLHRAATLDLETLRQSIGAFPKGGVSLSSFSPVSSFGELGAPQQVTDKARVMPLITQLQTFLAGTEERIPQLVTQVQKQLGPNNRISYGVGASVPQQEALDRMGEKIENLSTVAGILGRSKTLEPFSIATRSLTTSPEIQNIVTASEAQEKQFAEKFRPYMAITQSVKNEQVRLDKLIETSQTLFSMGSKMSSGKTRMQMALDPVRAELAKVGTDYEAMMVEQTASGAPRRDTYLQMPVYGKDGLQKFKDNGEAETQQLTISEAVKQALEHNFGPDAAAKISDTIGTQLQEALIKLPLTAYEAALGIATQQFTELGKIEPSDFKRAMDSFEAAMEGFFSTAEKAGKAVNFTSKDASMFFEPGSTNWMFPDWRGKQTALDAKFTSSFMALDNPRTPEDEMLAPYRRTQAAMTWAQGGKALMESFQGLVPDKQRDAFTDVLTKLNQKLEQFGEAATQAKDKLDKMVDAREMARSEAAFQSVMTGALTGGSPEERTRSSGMITRAIARAKELGFNLPDSSMSWVNMPTADNVGPYESPAKRDEKIAAMQRLMLGQANERYASKLRLYDDDPTKAAQVLEAASQVDQMSQELTKTVQAAQHATNAFNGALSTQYMGTIGAMARSHGTDMMAHSDKYSEAVLRLQMGEQPAIRAAYTGLMPLPNDLPASLTTGLGNLMSSNKGSYKTDNKLDQLANLQGFAAYFDTETARLQKAFDQLKTVEKPTSAAYREAYNQLEQLYQMAHSVQEAIDNIVGRGGVLGSLREGFTTVTTEWAASAANWSSVGQNFTRSFATDFSSAMVDIEMHTKSAGAAFEAFGFSILKTAASLATNKAVEALMGVGFSALGGLGAGLLGGGAGGASYVPTNSAPSNSFNLSTSYGGWASGGLVLAHLATGETVLPPEAVAHHGVSRLDAFRRGVIPGRPSNVDNTFGLVQSGSYILPASVVSQYGSAFAERLANAPHRAGGGLIGSTTAALHSSSGTGISINLPVTVQTDFGGTTPQDKETQTKLLKDMGDRMSKAAKQAVMEELVTARRQGGVLAGMTTGRQY